MSIAAINWVAKQRVGNSNAKALLFWLAFHHNAETGLCCPGIKTLQAEMEVGSVNTVRTAMRLLKKLGFITAQPELKNGAIYRTLYTLNLDRISAEAPAIGDRSSQVEPPSVNEGGAIDVGGSAADPGEGQQVTRGGSNGGRGEGQQVTPNREIEQGINRERNREVMCAPSGAPQPPEMSDDEIADLLESVPQEKGERPPFEKGAHLSEKGDHPSPAPKRKAAPRRRPATPCPFDADASIPDEYKAIAEKVGIGNPQQVFSAFVNHALATDRRLTVWPAGFRTWCLNELRYHPLQTAKPKPLHQRTADDYNW